MIFKVEQADHYKKFSEYGLPEMAWTYNDVILSDINEINRSEEVCFHFSEIEINSLEELIAFRKRCECPIIIDEVDKFYPSISKKYKMEIKLYNYYLE